MLTQHIEKTAGVQDLMASLHAQLSKPEIVGALLGAGTGGVGSYLGGAGVPGVLAGATIGGGLGYGAGNMYGNHLQNLAQQAIEAKRLEELSAAGIPPQPQKELDGAGSLNLTYPNIEPTLLFDNGLEEILQPEVTNPRGGLPQLKPMHPPTFPTGLKGAPKKQGNK